MMRTFLMGLLCALCLASAATAADASPAAAVQLTAKAGAAYQDKRFAEAAELYVEAAEAGANKIDAWYNAACSYALSGQADQAFANLQAAMDAGLRQNPAQDPDFKSLHGDPRWAGIMARYDAAHPEAKVVAILTDQQLPTAQRYFAGRKAIADGASIAETGSLFNQMYATNAMFVGEYDEANRVYGYLGAGRGADPVTAGFTRASDAVPAVLARARGRQAVFLNESHGNSQTRAANYALLAGLRAEGFGVLAMETLATTAPVARDADHCSNTTLEDAKLAERGYPIRFSGFYTLDPVYAETVREALRLGFRLVAYDSALSDDSQAAREQNQAENLACVFKEDPKARLVVIAGMSHINEGKDHWVPGGMMAYRFRELTGIDPLTVDTMSELDVDAKALSFDPDATARAPVSFVLQDADGKTWGNEQFDLMLFVPTPAHRDDGQPSWLELGGARHRAPVAAAECSGRELCLAEARRAGEMADAVPSDRCIIEKGESGCTLFLPPGSYEIATFDAAGVELGRRSTTVN